MHGDSRLQARWSGALSGVAGLAASVWLAYLALSQRLPAPAFTTMPGLAGQPAFAPCVMDRDGYWKGRLFGSSSLDIAWAGESLGCAGNARPGGRGIRLFFAGRPAPGEERIVLVLGIPAGIGELVGQEHPVSVTLIDEASSQFFHSQGDRCFTRIRNVAALGDGSSYRIEGDLYCTGAIASVSGANSVTLGDMQFAGRLTLGDAQ